MDNSHDYNADVIACVKRYLKDHVDDYDFLADHNDLVDAIYQGILEQFF